MTDCYFYYGILFQKCVSLRLKRQKRMTREEMIAKGLTPEETKHNGHRRAFFHNYSRPGLYMITLVTEGRKRLFGSIEGCARGKIGTADYPHLQYSLLGALILNEEVKKIPQFYPMVEVWKVALMPDHIHLLINVKARLPEGKHLGNVVRGFKTGCTRAWWKLEDEKPSGNALGTVVDGKPGGNALGADTVPEASSSGLRPLLFQAGYHDRIIMADGTLENICRYMNENPFRAKLREECPNLMQRQLHLWIQGREYAAFGNLFLLKYPEKEQVFFHRKNEKGTPTHLTPEYAQEKAKLLQHAEQGAVLVTPGISEGEKQVVQVALTEHLPLIILQKGPITEYWKPSQGRFYACAAGRLLILAPWNIVGDSDYARFHSLNDFAREICLATDTRLLGVGALSE